MSSARDVLSRLRLEDGDLWIDRAADFQLTDALAALEDSGRPYGFGTRGRGGSKTTDAGAVSLAWLATAPGGARGYWAASDLDQARLGIDSIRGFLDRAPELRGHVEVQQGKVVSLDSGASLEALPADAASSWGLRPEWLIVDELAWWSDTAGPRTFLDSLTSAAAKSKTARLWVITSPSDPAHFSAKLLEEARASDLWRVSEHIGLVPWLDPARVEEQGRRLTEPMYRRLFLGEWCEGDESLAAVGDVDACVSHDGPLDPIPGVSYVIGVDLGVRNDRAAAAVAHLDGDRVVVEAWPCGRAAASGPYRSARSSSGLSRPRAATTERTWLLIRGRRSRWSSGSAGKVFGSTNSPSAPSPPDGSPGR
jgi:hypothetical protein